MNPYRRAPLYASIDNGYCGCLVVIRNERKYLPLTKVSAHATLLASTSRTTLTQTFKNPTADTIKESRYVFPLFDGVSVVAFTCTIGKTVIQGVVKSKPEAKKEFNAAVARGEQAGLLEQSDRASDVFTTMLGNVGPNEEAKVEITYLGELKHDAEVDGLRYTMPTNIAPRYADDLVVPIPAHQSNVLDQATLNVTIDVDLATGAAIKSVQSPSHPISVNIGTRSTHPNDDPSLRYASASLTRSDVTLDKDLIVQVCAKGLGDPTAVLETHSTIPSRRAIMATLVPRFNLAVEKPEVVFICDRSGSMDSGSRLPNLIESLQVFLKSLPVGVLFNICSFGSSHAFLWPKSQPYNQTTLDQAIAHVKAFTANFGGTRIKEPVEATIANREKSRNLEAFLMTDGETWDEQATFDVINAAVRESKGAVRVFALGVGADASHSLIEGVARAGRGFAQSVGENEKMNKKVVRMLKGALTPHIDDYNLEIKYEKEDNEEFELVEKVSECTVVDNGEVAAAEKPTQATISLHDTSVNDEDLEMPDSKALAIPDLPTPTYLQAPHIIPPLFPFNRTSVYVLLSEGRAQRTPKSVVLRGTSPQGPLELEIPIHVIADKGTTIHQLAARKAVQDLEEGRGWIYDAKLANGKMLSETYAMQMTEVAKQAGVKLGVEYQVAGKWCSFVAVKKPTKEEKQDEPEGTGVSLPEVTEESDDFEMVQAQDASPPRSRSQPLFMARNRVSAPAPRRALASKAARKAPPVQQAQQQAQQQSANSDTSFGASAFGAPGDPLQQSVKFGQAQKTSAAAPPPPPSLAPFSVGFGGGPAGESNSFSASPFGASASPFGTSSPPPPPPPPSGSSGGLFGSAPSGRLEVGRQLSSYGPPPLPPPPTDSDSLFSRAPAPASNSHVCGNSHSLQNYQAKLTPLEEENKRRLMQQRNAQDMQEKQQKQQQQQLLQQHGLYRQQQQQQQAQQAQQAAMAQQMAIQQRQSQQPQPPKGSPFRAASGEIKRRRVSQDANPFGDSDEEEYDAASAASASPLEAIIALQTFSGSWTWSTRLERLLGVTQVAAGQHLAGRSAESTATLFAIAYLQARLADEEEVWELVVDKARTWLASELSLGEADIEALEAKAKEVLA